LVTSSGEDEDQSVATTYLEQVEHKRRDQDRVQMNVLVLQDVLQRHQIAAISISFHLFRIVMSAVFHRDILNCRSSSPGDGEYVVRVCPRALITCVCLSPTRPNDVTD